MRGAGSHPLLGALTLLSVAGTLAWRLASIWFDDYLKQAFSWMGPLVAPVLAAPLGWSGLFFFGVLWLALTATNAAFRLKEWRSKPQIDALSALLVAQEKAAKSEIRAVAAGAEQASVALRNELDSVTTDLSRAQNKLRDRDWERNWQSSPPVLQVVAPELAREARLFILTWANDISSLVRTLEMIGRDLYDAFAEQGRENAKSWAGSYYRELIHEPTRRLLASLIRCELDDARVLLRAAIEQYAMLRRVLPVAARIADRPLGSLSHYEEWRSADMRFLQRLHDLPNSDSLQELRYFANSLRERGQLVALPTVEELSASFTGTADEERFYELFVSHADEPQRDKPSTYLANEIYRAGVALSERSLVQRSLLADGKEKFCLLEATVATWRAAGRTLEPCRTCIVIDTHAVHCSRASGGASSGSRTSQ